MINYSSHTIEYQHEEHAEQDVSHSRRRSYARGRSFKEMRKRSRRKNNPGCGISARRNRRVDW